MALLRTARWPWCSRRLLGILALACVVVAHHAAAVHGLRRAELVHRHLAAPAPSPAAAGVDVAGIDAAKERFAATAPAAVATSDFAAQTSKWRVRRGSDPIHNRS